MKSKDSYKRISLQLNNNEFVEMENYLNDIDELREKIIFSPYDLAVVDEKLYWKNDAIHLFNKFEAKVILFQGDFELVIKNIEDFCTPRKSVVDINEEKDNSLSEEVLEENIRYITKKEIVYVDNPIKVPEYVQVYAGIKNQLILVTNLSQRAGSTFFSLNTARYLSEFNILPCIIEIPIEKPYIFDTIGLENRLDKTDNKESLNFYSYPHMIFNEEKLKRNKETIEDGIVFIIPDARLPIIKDTILNIQGNEILKTWDYNKTLKLVYTSKKSNISLVDVGSNIENPSINPLINEADKIIVIIDPLPTECMQNQDKLDMFKELKRTGFPVEFVVNRWNEGVNTNEFDEFLKVKPLMYIPSVNSKFIYKAVYDCIIPFDIPEVKDSLEKPLSILIKSMLPKEILSNFKKFDDKSYTSKFSKFKSLIGRKK